MKLKEYIPVLSFFSVFIFGFLFTSFLFKDELRGILLDRTIEYGTAEGVITKSGTQLDTGRYTSSLRIDMKYDYEVDSIPYTSSLVNYAADYHEIDHYLAKYPVGKKVMVYYEIDDPSLAVLEPDNKDWSIVLLPFGWIIFGGIIILVMYLSTKISWLKELMEWISKSTR